MWINSGTRPVEKEAVISLPNAVKGWEATALGLCYNVEDDTLCIRESVNLSTKIQKMH